jgi:NAD(P)-dependent dehydrogenase (short-subunit alcohol dehydrogenase family)
MTRTWTSLASVVVSGDTTGIGVGIAETVSRHGANVSVANAGGQRG